MNRLENPAIEQAPNRGLSELEKGLAWDLPEIPATIDAQRRHRKQRVAAGCRLFALYGFDFGPAGHITARDPAQSDHFWVNPLGMHFSQVKASDLILVNHDGVVVEGRRPVNRAAFAIHSAIHKARPDVTAAAHAHSPYGKTWSTFGRLLDPLTQESCAFYRDHVVFDEFSGVVLETSEGERIAERLGHRKAAILQNHGLLTVGTSVEAALFWFIALEDACKTQLLAESVGKPKHISHEVAAQTVDQIDRLDGGKYGFQPFWDYITASQPDLLD